MITQRSVVLLTILTGPERTPTTYPGTVLATTPTLDEKYPAGDIAYLAPQRANLIGTPDWRNAFDRCFGVKHKSHDDVTEARETAWYEEVLLATFAEVEQVAAADVDADDEDGDINEDPIHEVVRQSVAQVDKVTEITQPAPETAATATTGGDAA